MLNPSDWPNLFEEDFDFQFTNSKKDKKERDIQAETQRRMEQDLKQTNWELELDKIKQQFMNSTPFKTRLTTDRWDTYDGTLGRRELRQAKEKALSDLSNANFQKDTRDNLFRVEFDVYEFDPETVKVRLEDDNLVVEAKQQIQNGDSHRTKREFYRKVAVPSGANSERMICKLSNAGLLEVKIPAPPSYFEAFKDSKKNIGQTETDGPAETSPTYTSKTVFTPSTLGRSQGNTEYTTSTLGRTPSTTEYTTSTLGRRSTPSTTEYTTSTLGRTPKTREYTIGRIPITTDYASISSSPTRYTIRTKEYTPTKAEYVRSTSEYSPAPIGFTSSTRRSTPLTRGYTITTSEYSPLYTPSSTRFTPSTTSTKEYTAGITKKPSYSPTKYSTLPTRPRQRTNSSSSGRVYLGRSHTNTVDPKWRTRQHKISLSDSLDSEATLSSSPSDDLYGGHSSFSDFDL